MPADPRALAQLLRLGSAQREDALLQAQMEQAARAAQPRGRVYGTAGGAIMGGLGDAIREMGGGFRQNSLQSQAADAERGRVDARQQWLSAALRGQPPPAGAAPLEPSPQEQAAGMAAALRGEQAQGPTAPDALTKLAPYQPGPLLGGGAALSGIPAAPLAPLAGQGGKPGDVLRAKLSGPVAPQAPGATLPGAAEVPGASGISDVPRPMESAPAAPESPTAVPDLSPEQYAELAIASGDPAMAAWGKTVLEQANLKDTLGAKRQESDARVKADAEKQKLEMDKFGHEQRDKLQGLQEWKDAKAARTSLEIVKREGSRGTAFGDMSMIYALVTGEDPKSGVKDAEFDAFANAQSVPSRIVNLYYSAKAGTKLTPEQRADVLRSSENLFKSRTSAAVQAHKEYSGYLARAGLNPKDYLPSIDDLLNPPKSPKVNPEVLTGPNGQKMRRQDDGTYLPMEE